MKIKKNILVFLFIFIFSFVYLLINDKKAYADEIVEKNPQIKSIENSDSYVYDGDETEMSYNANSLGEISILGDITSGGSFRNVEAYGINNYEVSINYKYINFDLVSDENTGYAIYSDSSTKVSDISLGKKIKMGAVILQSSDNNYLWNNVTIVNDFFSSSDNNVNLYTTNQNEVVKGMYYRIIVAYKLRHKISSKKYDYKYCCETSTFYICYDKNTVILRDLVTREEITSGECESGFIVDKMGSTNLVQVYDENNNIIVANDKASFNKKGTYNVVVTNKFGAKYSSNIEIINGINEESALTRISESKNNSGYSISNLKDNGSYCNNPYSEVFVGVSGNDSVVCQNDNEDYNSIGIKASSCSIFLKLNSTNLNSGYRVVYDEYGKYENEKVAGILTGKVGTGALIIQKSYDNKNWSTYDSIYENGVFTTDYKTSYGDQGEVFIFSPLGEDIINGVYIRILYAFELYNDELDDTINSVEVHTMYLCSESLDSITFHNLTVGDDLGNVLSDEDPTTLDVYKQSETLIDGSETKTGFTIDTSLNPLVSISIKKDGLDYEIPSDMTITSDGRYDITLTSKLNDSKTITIYVNNKSFEELNELYFNNSFLTGKRIYSETIYPTYEASLVNYNINGLSNNYEYLWGYIKNLTTGNEEFINSGSEEILETIYEAGEYIVKLNTNNTFNSNNKSGDNHVFTFHFNVIEAGTAPGPVVNKRNLEDYSKISNASNFKPTYYGITYPSAGKGYITLAFASYKAAREYGYEYEKGMVEKQSDGSYRYVGSLNISQKVKYESNWDLVDYIYYFVDESIKELYFDMSDEFTFTTVKDEVLNSVSNLRTLELNNSIVIIAEGELNKIINSSDTPIINSKKIVTINPGLDGEIERSYSEFKLIKDKYGYDSYQAFVIDKNNNEFELNYNESLESQLIKYNFETGIITIKEITVYGDITTYNAIYIKENDVTLSFDLKYYDVDNSLKEKEITQDDNNLKMNVKAFQILNVSDLYDYNGLILVESNNEVKSYWSMDSINELFYLKGNYVITLINSLGYKYSIELNILENYFSKVDIEGFNEYIIYGENDEVITLPKLTKYGYDFIGYEINDSVYNDEINSILIKGKSILKPVFEAKKFNLILMLGDYVYENRVITFGETYDLPFIDSEDFLGWGDDNIKTLSVEEEGDLILSANFGESQETESTYDYSYDYSYDYNSNTSNSSTPFYMKPWFIITVVIIFVLIVVFIFGFIWE